jgi:uncharacterized protein (DUF2235 family)
MSVMRPEQRLILLFDGTWNDTCERTNVFRLAASIEPADGPTRQRFFYHPGVGTSVGMRLLGGATGAGLQEILLAGYEWLARRYSPGDEIWVFGFSRGAYTARSLVGMIRKCGLMRIVTPGAIREAVELYRDKTAPPDGFRCTSHRGRYARPDVRIHCIGVWDTVGALGVPGLTVLPRSYFEWHDTQLSGIVDRAYHAVALDEHREIFDVSLWTGPLKPSHLDVEQRWFIGSHGDVGGGCPLDDLARIPLRWMQDKATAAGLKLKPLCEPPPAADRAPIYDSYALFAGGAYAAARSLMPWKNGRFTRLFDRDHFGNPATKVTIDPTVLARRSAGGYDPATLRGRV